MASSEEIQAFQTKHPDLAKWLEPSRLAHNSGLATRRLLRLVQQHPELESRLEPLLPVSLFATRKEIQDFQQQNPELADAKVVETPPLLGIRQTRFIEGEYKLTADDALEGRRFDDVVAISSCAIIHYYGYRRCGWVRQFDAYGNYIGRVRSCY